MTTSSLLFASTPPIGVHVRWDSDALRHRLWVFTDRAAADAFQRTLPVEEAVRFASAAKHLRAGVEPVRCEFTGDIARLLSNFLIDYHAVHDQEFEGLAPRTLCGFWDPPATGLAGYGLILWIDIAESCIEPRFHAFIARSQEQAWQTGKELHWLEGRKKVLLERIRHWNALEHSRDRPIHIEGPVARLLCDASLYQRIEDALGARGVKMKPRAARRTRAAG